jgi:hypothetical protein
MLEVKPVFPATTTPFSRIDALAPEPVVSKVFPSRKIRVDVSDDILAFWVLRFCEISGIRIPGEA